MNGRREELTDIHQLISMSAHAQALAVLQPHPDTPGTGVENIQTTLCWTPSGMVTVTYTLTGMVDQFRIPESRSALRSDDLWRHTCFELFIGAKNDAEYYEFNFSPSGEWALYGFTDYREGGPLSSAGSEPTITVQREGRNLNLTASVRLDGLPGIRSNLCLWIGLAAVIEDLSGSLSYWALKHPPGKPDFHHPDNFALQIEPAVGDGAVIDYTVSR